MSTGGPAGGESTAARSQIHSFPTGIIEVRLRPGGIVANVKLPWASEINRRFAKPYMDKIVCRRGVAALRLVDWGGSIR
jgi:hypothetical protein